MAYRDWNVIEFQSEQHLFAIYMFYMEINKDVVLTRFPFFFYNNLDFVEGKIFQLILYYLHNLNIFIFCSLFCVNNNNSLVIIFFNASIAPVALNLLLIEVSRSHRETSHFFYFR
jgi:hypothetical protein